MHNTYSYIKYKKENEYLAHHGILGQKWGKKNGPPYPLDPEDHSAAEKKENHGHYSQGVTQDRGGSGSSSGAQNEPQNDKKQLDKKKILKAAAITAGVMTVVGGTSIGVALAVKEPEVFGNALDSLKNATIDNFTKEGQEMREYAKEMSKGKGYDGEDSKVLEKEIVNNYKEGLNEQRRAERNEKRFNRQTKDMYNETDEMKDDLAEQMAKGREKSSDERKQSMLDEARAEEKASRKAQASEEAKLSKAAKEAEDDENDLAEQMARGREKAESRRASEDTREGMKAQDAAYKARDKENNQYVREGKREEFKEKVNNFNDAYKEFKGQKNAAEDRRNASEAMGKLKEKQNLSEALNRLRNGNYSNDDAGQDQRQSDYNLLYDKDPRGLSSIMGEARSRMGKNQAEQTSNWAKMENTKRMQDKQNYNARKNAEQYAKDHPTTKFGKAKQKVEKATTWANKAADTVNRATGTVYKVKGAYDNAMRVAGMVGGIGTAVGAIGAANKRKQQQQYQQQGGYQENINPQYQQQTQQFKKKKR